MSVDQQCDVAVCLTAFRLRRPDARERARRLRDYYATVAERARDRGDAAAARAAEATARTLADLLYAFRNRNLAGDDVGATPEALTKLRFGYSEPLARLWQQGHLDEGHVRAAWAIARVVRSVTRSLEARAPLARLTTAASTAPSNAFEATTLEHAMVYQRWAKDQPPERVKMVLGLAVEGLSVSALARRHRRRWRSALSEIRTGLESYWTLRLAALQPRAPSPVAADE